MVLIQETVYVVLVGWVRVKILRRILGKKELIVLHPGKDRE
jgi:hypothetical protein